MKIVLMEHYNKDRVLLGQEFIETHESPDNYVNITDEKGNRKVSHLEFLSMCNADPSLRARAGYNVATQLPDEDAPKTKWQRIVEACNAQPEDSEEFKLGLKV